MKYRIKNRLTKALSTIMVIILFLGAFSGCAQFEAQNTGSTTQGENSTPSETTKPLSREELEAAYYNTEAVKFIDEIVREDMPISPEELEAAKELCAQKYDLNKEEIKIIVRGKYDDMYAVVADGYYYYGVPDHFETVGGYEFAYGFTTPLMFIKNQETYSLAEVYERGWISNEELYRLSIRCKYIDYEYYRVDNMAEVSTSLMVTMMPSQNSKEFTCEDFPEINCIKVKDISSKKALSNGKIAKMLVLYVEKTTPQKILEYVCMLGKRNDIHIVSPNGRVEFDAAPNDPKYQKGDR